MNLKTKGALERARRKTIQKKQLKIYIWEDFEPDWTSGLAVAIAETEKEARKLVEDEHGYEPSNWGEMKVRPFSKCAFCVSGGS
jgi:hypothetical protein